MSLEEKKEREKAYRENELKGKKKDERDKEDEKNW